MLSYNWKIILNIGQWEIKMLLEETDRDRELSLIHI